MRASVMDGLNALVGGGLRSASAFLSEKIIGTGDSGETWTASANVTATNSTAHFKRGTESAKLAFAGGFTTGKAAYSVGQLSNLNMVTGGYTDITFWVYSSVARAAAVFQIGLDDAADFSTAYGTGTRFVSFPAIPEANTWYRVTLALTTAMKDLTAVSSVGIWALVDPLTTDLYIDDIRLIKVETHGEGGVAPSALAPIHTLGNTDQDVTTIHDLLIAPFPTKLVSIFNVPVDLTLIGYQGEIGAWSADDTEQDALPLLVGGSVLDALRVWTSGAIRRTADLASGEQIQIAIGG